MSVGKLFGHLINISTSYRMEDQSTPTLLDLNDDCLYEIYSYIDFRDKIRMSSLCLRLQYILELYLRRTKAINITFKILFNEYVKIFEKHGQHIEKLSFDDTSYLSAKPIKKKKLQNKFFNIFLEISKLKNLRILDLRNCQLELSVNRFTFETPNEVSYEYPLEMLLNYSTLPVKELSSLHLSDYNAIFSNLKNLKELNIEGFKLDISAFQALADNLDELEKFSFSVDQAPYLSSYEKLTHLRKLKDLTIDAKHNWIHNILQKLFAHKKDDLKILTLKNYKHNKTSGNVLMDFKNLTDLNIQSSHFNQSCLNDFIEDISKCFSLKRLDVHQSLRDLQADLYLILNLIENSPSVNYINIENIKVVNDYFFDKAINILEKKDRLMPLKVEFTSFGIIPDPIQAQRFRKNRDILRVIEHWNGKTIFHY